MLPHFTKSAQSDGAVKVEGHGKGLARHLLSYLGRFVGVTCSDTAASFTTWQDMASGKLLIGLEVAVMHIDVRILAARTFVHIQAAVVVDAADGVIILIKVPLLVGTVMAFVHVDIVRAVHGIVQTLVVIQCEDVSI